MLAESFWSSAHLLCPPWLSSHGLEVPQLLGANVLNTLCPVMKGLATVFTHRGLSPNYQVSMPAQEQTRLRSPWTLSIRPTAGQNLWSCSHLAGKQACWRE